MEGFYLWNDASVGQTLSVSSAGQYFVRVTDPSGCIGRDTISITVSSLPVVELILDVNVCEGASPVTLADGFPAPLPPAIGQYSGTGITTSPIFDPVVAGVGFHLITYSYTDGNGCNNNAVDTAFVHAPPVVDIGPNQSFCENTNLTFDAGNPGSTYTWNDGSSNQTLTVTSAGIYHVLVTDGNGCTGRDTAEAVMDPAPLVDLGNDQSICAGTTITLNAGNPGLTHEWNDGTTQSTLTISDVGVYFVEVTDAIGCIGRDTMELLSIYPTPTVALGSDVTICNGSTLNLDAGSGWSNYLWNDGSSNQTLGATSIGQYWVEVTDGNGCIGRDTVAITGFSNSLAVDIGNDQSICSGTGITLNALNPGSTYMWNDGSSGQTNWVNAVGIYHVLVTDLSGCQGRDTMEITALNPTPTVDIGNNQALCTGSTVTLDAGNPGSTFLWSDGSAAQTLTVNSVGKYVVTVNDGFGCLGIDSMEVTGIYSDPILNLGNDTSICTGTSVTFDGGSGHTNYTWSDGSSNQTLIANAVGQYSVEITDVNGCTATDLVEVLSIHPLPTVSVNSASICPEDGAETFTATSPTATSYLWSDNGLGTSPTTSGTIAGNYTVTVKDINGCEETATGTLSFVTSPSGNC